MMINVEDIIWGCNNNDVLKFFLQKKSEYECLYSLLFWKKALVTTGWTLYHFKVYIKCKYIAQLIKTSVVVLMCRGKRSEHRKTNFKSLAAKWSSHKRTIRMGAYHTKYYIIIIIILSAISVIIIIIIIIEVVVTIGEFQSRWRRAIRAYCQTVT